VTYDPGAEDDNTDDTSSDDYDNWDSDAAGEQENLPGGDGYGR